ncbi:hypothetical protein RB595_010414 [Gaeumannomyces hyphopodioides]
MDEDDAYYLGQVLGDVSQLMIVLAVKLRHSTAAEIGTRLHIIAEPLVEGYATDDIAKPAGNLSKELLRLQKSLGEPETPREACDLLSTFLRDGTLEETLKSLLQQQSAAVQDFSTKCEILYESLQASKNATTPEAMPRQPLDSTQLPDCENHPEHVNELLFQVLQLHTGCPPQRHQVVPQIPPTDGDKGRWWHPTRLHLAGSAEAQKKWLDLCDSVEAQKKRAVFNIVVSSVEMRTWQEFMLGIPTMQVRAGQPQARTGRRKVRFATDKLLDKEEAMPETSLNQEDMPEISLPVESGGLCKLIDRRVSARIGLHLEADGLKQLRDTESLARRRLHSSGEGLTLSNVLLDYKLTPKAKVSLAYVIARACWQFYASDIMRTDWTSDSVWFMPEGDESQRAGQLPFRVYLSLDFAQITGDMPDYREEDYLSHRLPRILELGIILLEVGLGQPWIRDDMPTDTDPVSRINARNGQAVELLRELESEEWDFDNKHLFTEAIENCLNYKNFLATDELPKKPATRDSVAPTQVAIPGRGSSEPKATTLLEAATCEKQTRGPPEERRKKLLEHVVRPLAKLFKAFKCDQDPVLSIDRHESPVLPLSRQRSIERDKSEPRRFLSQEAQLHAGRPIMVSQWFENLKSIGGNIRKREIKQKPAVIKPVKVAVIDTGYASSMSFFQDPVRAKNIKDWKDFAAGAESSQRTDTFGHGSFMLRLLMESSPLAQIYVARVAENTEMLSYSRDNVAKAVRWAGLENDVDIITMSFGFPDSDPAIAKAIREVHQKRKTVIFFASAGNGSVSQKKDSFPARHHRVISIHATNCDGIFLRTSPKKTPSGKQHMPAWVFHCHSHISRVSGHNAGGCPNTLPGRDAGRRRLPAAADEGRDVHDVPKDVDEDGARHPESVCRPDKFLEQKRKT